MRTIERLAALFGPNGLRCQDEGGHWISHSDKVKEVQRGL